MYRLAAKRMVGIRLARFKCTRKHLAVLIACSVFVLHVVDAIQLRETYANYQPMCVSCLTVMTDARALWFCRLDLAMRCVRMRMRRVRSHVRCDVRNQIPPCHPKCACSCAQCVCVCSNLGTFLHSHIYTGAMSEAHRIFAYHMSFCFIFSFVLVCAFGHKQKVALLNRHTATNAGRKVHN